MRVVDHEPGLWFLLADGERLLLDINCEHGAVSYDVLIELSDGEKDEYEKHRHAYLSKLAEAVNYSAPGVRGSQSVYRSRNISSQFGVRVTEAVAEWRGQQAPEASP